MITGVKGQLGYDLKNELLKRGHEVVGVDIEEMDITDPKACERVIFESKVDGVFHCAAYTAVDAAEDNKDLCMKINVEGTENIARVCETLGIKMLYLSTDYVFNGQGETPWDPDDLREPINTYGMSKYLGEIAVTDHVEKFFIVRISWVFGINGKNFIKTMLELSKTHDTLRIVSDQTGSPTFTYDLSRLLVDMMETEKYGFYHASNEGLCTWYEFAEAIFEEAGVKNMKLIPVTTEEYNAKAVRPKNSRLDKDKLVEYGFEPLPHWRDAMKRFIAEYLKK